ncbi:hypothetical protein PLEOSDRAFT_1100649 [Pleurotus ostreatus PC15]|uniref:Uncharacterized protein n=1 Tax=Pleurotus ostreatus (strain PC15) TaxID=1137138 RepID=A0A067NVN2_PLEO1|nr:hypothetical protein PLEOSDRAFT_1100649 [Pleurotus ostreatus PC15]
MLDIEEPSGPSIWLSDMFLQIIEGFENMSQAQFTTLYHHFTQVRSLHLKNTSIRCLGPLMKSSSTELPLPLLETLYLSGCELSNTKSLQAVKDFLEERKALSIPIGTTTDGAPLPQRSSKSQQTLTGMTMIRGSGANNNVSCGHP